MNREARTDHTQLNVEQAILDARQAVDGVVLAVDSQVLEVALNGRNERAGLISQNESEGQGLVKSGEETRTNRVESFALKSKQTIKAAQLKDPVSKKNIETWLEDKLKVITRTEDDSTEVIRNRNQINKQAVADRESATRVAIDERLKLFKNYSQHHKFDTSLDVFFRNLTQKANAIEGFTTIKTQELTSLISTRRENLNQLIKAKDSSQIRQISTAEAELKRKLEALLAQERQKQARSNTGNAGSSQGSTGSSSGQQNRARSQATSSKRDPRYDVLSEGRSNEPVRPYNIFLSNLDHHRGKGKTDQDIYKLLIRHFHPDVSGHELAEQVSRVLTSAYDTKTKKFKV